MDRVNRASVWGAVILSPLSFVLGFIGYSELGSGSYSPSDAAFGAIQLFVMETQSDLDHPSLALNIARFAAPLALALATVATLIALLGQELRRASISWRGHDHVVLIGVTDDSAALGEGLLSDGVTVVLITADLEAPQTQQLVQNGAVAFIGDGRQTGLLQRCRVQDARHVVVMADSDTHALEICELLTSVMQPDSRTSIHVAVHDETLWEQLDRTEIQQASGSRGALEFFNVADRKAMAFLQRMPLELDGKLPTHVYFQGDGALGRRVLLRWAQQLFLTGDHVSVLVPPVVHEQLVRPLIEKRPWLLSAIMFEEEDAPGPSSVAIVCSEEADGHSLGLALQLVNASDLQRALVWVHGTAGRGVLDSRGLSSKVRMVQADSAWLHPRAFFGHSWIDLMARARHEDYCVNELSRGVTPEENPSLVGWSDLPDSLRDSNRRFARGVGAVLSRLGARVVPLQGPADLDLSLGSLELVTELARDEHDRWMADLVRDGWTFGPGPKDAVAKTHPLLVPWADLSESEREKDRDSIRAIPRMLARVGYALELPTPSEEDSQVPQAGNRGF